jgi:hypothetical protein
MPPILTAQYKIDEEKSLTQVKEERLFRGVSEFYSGWQAPTRPISAICGRKQAFGQSKIEIRLRPAHCIRRRG